MGKWYDSREEGYRCTGVVDTSFFSFLGGHYRLCVCVCVCVRVYCSFRRRTPLKLQSNAAFISSSYALFLSSGLRSAFPLTFCLEHSVNTHDRQRRPKSVVGGFTVFLGSGSRTKSGIP